ncbi:HlyD family secretion protein [Tenuifilum osseticum]|uniref:HlyD family secretion protein n=1 Tax=Tenuifilum osseticum TaxID=3374723 RepID=UPI0034E4E7AA
MEDQQINIRSEEINEILGVPPRWIIRWGITVIFCVIVAIFIGSIFFKYPDTVVAPAVITAENPPSVVMARTTGKPRLNAVKDGDFVKRGDTLGVIENPANFEDIVSLAKFIRDFDIDRVLAGVSPNQFNTLNFVLGEVQNSYSAFTSALTNYTLFHKQKLHLLKIDALEGELKQYINHLKLLNLQHNLLLREYEITQKQFKRDSLLLQGKVIAQADFEKSQSTLLSKQQGLENSKLTISSTSITIEKLKQTIAETKIDLENQKQKVYDDVVKSFNQLKSALASWEKNYLLVAPSSGKLSFMGIWSDLQEVKTGEPIFAIIPENLGEIQVRLVIPFESAGKVRVNQRVNIKLDGYPYIEYGTVEGIISSISSGYNEQGFPAMAKLPNGAVTTYGTVLNFDRELRGTAEISTDNLTVFQRLFNHFKYLYKEKLK